MSKRDDDARVPWRKPTRRAFVGMLAAAAAAVLAPAKVEPPVAPPTRWIGHC